MLSSNFVECNENGGVDGSRDVEEGSGNAFHARDAAFIKFRCGIGFGRLLHLGPIPRCKPFVGKVLRARGYRLLEVLQGFADGAGNGYVDVIARVIIFDGKTAVPAARWVHSDGVILPEGVEEVGGVFGSK